jgi:peptide/nickel transport system substrate-binding protein
MELAGQLAGQTIRIGYLGPDERLAAMVQAIKESCEAAGVTVEDVAAEHMSQIHLEIDPETGLPTIDAFLGPVDPMYEYGGPEALIQNVSALRVAEEKLWEDLYDIPVSAQPRTFILDRSVENVVPYTGLSGIGWNMDRWNINEELLGQVTATSEETSEQ